MQIRRCTYRQAFVPTLNALSFKGGIAVYGVFGGYTRWAVVFLIIFVLFFLLIPMGGVVGGVGGTGVTVTSYHAGKTAFGYGPMGGYEGESS